jgi:hypothetical protein
MRIRCRNGPQGLFELFEFSRKTGGPYWIEPVTFSVSGKIVEVLNWVGEPLRCNYQQLCRWMSLDEALCGWQLAPRMAPILAIIDP